MSDVIKLDNHRLLCGNAQVKADVDKLLDGVQVDLLLTDPPYGIDIVNPVGGGQRESIGARRARLNFNTHTPNGNNWRKQTSKFQIKEQWESVQQVDSREREREREQWGKVGKPRRCRSKTLQTSNR